MFTQKDYKISVYSDSLANKNTYRTLIWLHIHDKFEFLQHKERNMDAYTQQWSLLYKTYSVYYLCQQLLFLSSKKETIRVDTHTQCIVVIMTLTYMITDTLTMAGSRLRSSVVKNFGSLFQLFGKSLIKSFMLAILFRMQRVI